MITFEFVRNEGLAVMEDILNHLAYLFEGKKRVRWDKEKEAAFLLHGYLQGDAAFRNMEEFLVENAIDIESESYPFWKDLEEVEDILLEKCRHLHEWQGRINLVGHSLGGLVARAVAQKAPEYFKRVITLAAPHHGTYSALLGYFTKSARQMIPGSEYLKRLDKAPLPEGVKFYSIYSMRDPLILPYRSARLNGAVNIELRSVGHIGLIGPKVYTVILNILRGKRDREKGVTRPVIVRQG